MATKCSLHPGRDSAGTIYSQNYCQKCLTGIAAARAGVDKHVEPKECFIWYRANDDWAPIAGTGCAHWVSHQKGIKTGSAMDKCRNGYTYRVKVTVQGKSEVTDLNKVQLNDIWVNDDKSHTGLVLTVKAGAKPTDKPTITIRHDSSGQGKVSNNDWATFFHGKGKFYR